MLHPLVPGLGRDGLLWQTRLLGAILHEHHFIQGRVHHAIVIQVDLGDGTKLGKHLFPVHNNKQNNNNKKQKNVIVISNTEQGHHCQ
jgi:hypothetical protein